MEAGTDLERPESTELTEAREAELAQEAVADLGDDAPQLPLLQVTQQLSKVVASGKRESGHFLNSLTGEDYGTETELVVVYAAKGRFLSDRQSKGVYVAFGDVAPSNWPERYADKRFDELPDAEETFKARANAGEIEWGSGPPIRTTKNFVGFNPADPAMPLRLSLMRTSAPAATKIESILRWALKAPWHNVIELRTELEHDAQDNPYYVVRAEQGRQTTPEERQEAVAMSSLIKDSLDRLKLVGDSDEAEDAKAARRESASQADPEALDVT